MSPFRPMLIYLSWRHAKSYMSDPKLGTACFAATE